MMTTENLNAPAAGATDPTAGAATTTTEPQADAKPPVAADVIPAELPHPTTMGTPLSRGARYIHHFEVELISDGKRLWHVLSAEGQAVVATLFAERKTEQDAIDAHKAAAGA